MAIDLNAILAQLDEGTKSLLQEAITKVKARAEEARAKKEADAAEAKRLNQLAEGSKVAITGVLVKGLPRIAEALAALKDLGWKDGISVKIPFENPESMTVFPMVKLVATKGPSNGRGGKRTPITVNGTEYPSKAAAYRALIGEMSSPMNGNAIVSALTNAGHTVS